VVTITCLLWKLHCCYQLSPAKFVRKTEEFYQINLFTQTRVCRCNYFILGKCPDLTTEWKLIGRTAELFTDSTKKISILRSVFYNRRSYDRTKYTYLRWRILFCLYKNRRENAIGRGFTLHQMQVHRNRDTSVPPLFRRFFRTYLTGN